MRIRESRAERQRWSVVVLGRGADYAVARILAEAFPDEAQALYGRYANSYATGPNIIDLPLVASLGAGQSR